MGHTQLFDIGLLDVRLYKHTKSYKIRSEWHRKSGLFHGCGRPEGSRRFQTCQDVQLRVEAESKSFLFFLGSPKHPKTHRFQY